MTRTTQYNQYYRLPLNGNEGVLLDYTYPSDPAGAYAPNVNDALIAEKTIVFTAHELELDGIGGVTPQTGQSWQNAAYVETLPAIPTDHMREYTIWGHATASVANGDGVMFSFNHIDNSNRWTLNFVYQTASNRWALYLLEATGGTYTGRGTDQYFSSTPIPTAFKLNLVDAGDLIIYGFQCWETDSNSDVAISGSSYYASSRNHKATQATKMSFHEDPHDTVFINAVRIADVRVRP